MSQAPAIISATPSPDLAPGHAPDAEDEFAASEVERLVCDPSKARDLIGWRSAMADREGLKLGFTHSLEWFANSVNRSHYHDVQRYVV